MGKARPIKDFPQYYVTDEGNVYSRNYHMTGRTKKLTPSKDKKGYLFVPLCKNGKRYLRKVHRLVAQAFIPNPHNKEQINHKNGIRNDNKVENLEWCTCEENIIHEYTVLQKNKNLNRTILQLQNNKIIDEFNSSTEAEKRTGIDHSNIIKCCKGKYHTAGRFVWQYK